MRKEELEKRRERLKERLEKVLEAKIKEGWIDKPYVSDIFCCHRMDHCVKMGEIYVINSDRSLNICVSNAHTRPFISDQPQFTQTFQVNYCFGCGKPVSKKLIDFLVSEK